MYNVMYMQHANTLDVKKAPCHFMYAGIIVTDTELQGSGVEYRKLVAGFVLSAADCVFYLSFKSKAACK